MRKYTNQVKFMQKRYIIVDTIIIINNMYK